LNNKFSGKFIVLDGPDGCGKTTQAKLLAEWLQKQGVQTASFRDPGDTVIGEKIRRILLSQQKNFLMVDGTGNVETVHQKILQLISEVSFT